VWAQNLSKHDVYTVRVARNEFHDHTAVADKEPWEYDVRSPFYWSGNEDDNSFFVTHGDYPQWADRTDRVLGQGRLHDDPLEGPHHQDRLRGRVQRVPQRVAPVSRTRSRTAARACSARTS
jgi:hypothetical protein